MAEINTSLQGIMHGVYQMQDRGKEFEIAVDRFVSTHLNKVNGAKKFDKSNAFGFANVKTPKVELMKFGGNNPREWIKKCQRFFLLNPIPYDQRVLFASLHLEGLAETWFQNCFESVEGVSWEMFVENLCARFTDSSHENIVGEFIKLQQVSTVNAYQEKFESLKPLVLSKNKGLSEEFFVDSFLSGLKDEIRLTIKMFNPKTLNHAYSLARLQEATLEFAKKGKFLSKYGGGTTVTGAATTSNNAATTTSNYRGLGKGKAAGILENPYTKSVGGANSFN